MRKGATMREGVCCHRGLSVGAVSYSGFPAGISVENAHAEVRTRDGCDDCAERRVDVAVDMKARMGRFDAIGGFGAGL